MSKAPAFQFYANDFMDATRFMEANAVGLYVRCLCIQWTQGGLPQDVRTLAKGVGMDFEEFERVWPVVASKFAKSEDGLLRNKRLEGVRSRQEDVSSKRSDAGKAGALAKANAKANASTKKQQRKVKVEGEVEEGRKERAGAEINWPPWAGEKTRAAWDDFKAHKLAHHRFKYKTPKSEQAAIDLLGKMFTKGPDCVNALKEAMARGWQFPVDPAGRKSNNGTVPFIPTPIEEWNPRG